MTSARCRITRSRVTSVPRPLPLQVSCIARSHLLLILLLVDLSQAPDHRIKTKMELDLCHAQCLATCRELEDSLCNCTKWKDANNAQSDVIMWLADCPDPESFDCSGTCSEFQKQNETFPIRPEVWIYNDAANGLTILNWVTDAEPSSVFFVARVWPTQYGEIWATTIEVMNVSSLTFTNNKGPCFSPDLRVAAVSSAGIAGFSKPAKTIVSPPGQPRNISLTILDHDQTSMDNETIVYTLMWKPDFGWSGDELKYEVKVDTKCMNKHLDQFYIINDNIQVAKDHAKEDLFVQTGRMFTYAIGCTFNFQLNMTHVCDQEINSDAAQFSYTLGCQDVHSYYTGEHCLPPPIVEPGPVRKVKVNALPLPDSQLVVVTWLPPENLGSAGYVSAYHVVWGLIRITPVANSLDAFAQMYIADVLGNRTVPGTEFGTDIHVNKSDMPPNTDIGITVRAIGPNQVINNDVQGLVYKDANQWTAGHQQGTVVADDGTIVVLQYKKVSSDSLTWNRDPPLLRTGTTIFNNDTTTSSRETPSFDDDTLSFEKETTLSFSQDAPFNGSTHLIESFVRVTSDFPGVMTHKHLSGALLFWRRHMLGVNTTDILGYRIQWGLTDSECISNQSIVGEFCDGQAFTTVTDEEFLPLYNLTTNMTYGLKIKPVHNLSFFDTDDTTWDDVVVHTFVLSDLPELIDDPVTPGTSVMPSTSEAGVKGATSDDDQVDLTLVTIAVSCSAAVLLLCVLAAVFWLKRKRLKRSSLTYMGSPDDRNYSVFVPGKSLNSIPKGPLATDEWELPLSCLKFGPILGSGAFGKVVKGRISRAMLTHRGVASLLADYGACLQEGDTVHATVAIKLLQGDCEGVYRQDFLKEIQLMKKIGYHENIVSMLGCCTLRDPVCLVVEHVGQGDLLNYLKSIRHKLQALPSSRRQYVNSIVEIIDPLDLLRFAGHITRGMDFLASKGFVHRDLAARNVLVGNNKVCKIGDFGLARYVYDNVVYINRRGGRLPVKWMSEEAIFDLTFSTASDVWSFGIVLFEIVTLGGTPYPTIPTRNLLKELQKGYRMEKPVNCSQELYAVMLRCWEKEPTSRPSFTYLSQWLDGLISESSALGHIDLTQNLGHSQYWVDDVLNEDEDDAIAQRINLPNAATAEVSQHSNVAIDRGSELAKEETSNSYTVTLSDDSGYVGQQKVSVSSSGSNLRPSLMDSESSSPASLTMSNKNGSSPSFSIYYADTNLDDVFFDEVPERKIAQDTSSEAPTSLLSSNPLGHAISQPEVFLSRHSSSSSMKSVSLSGSASSLISRQRRYSETDMVTSMKKNQSEASEYMTMSRLYSKTKSKLSPSVMLRKSSPRMFSALAVDNKLYRAIGSSNKSTPPACIPSRKLILAGKNFLTSVAEGECGEQFKALTPKQELKEKLNKSASQRRIMVNVDVHQQSEIPNLDTRLIDISKSSSCDVSPVNETQTLSDSFSESKSNSSIGVKTFPDTAKMKTFFPRLHDVRKEVTKKVKAQDPLSLVNMLTLPVNLDSLENKRIFSRQGNDSFPPAIGEDQRKTTQRDPNKVTFLLHDKRETDGRDVLLGMELDNDCTYFQTGVGAERASAKRTSSWEDLRCFSRINMKLRRNSSDPHTSLISEPSPQGSSSSSVLLVGSEDDSQQRSSPALRSSVSCFWWPSPRKRRMGTADDTDLDLQPENQTYPNEKHPSALHLVSDKSIRSRPVSSLEV